MTKPDPHSDDHYEILERAELVAPFHGPNTTFLEIVAPTTLMEGYELQVNVDGKLMTVVVPPGGVEKGQRFQAAVVNSPMYAEAAKGHNVPVGHWRDGLCECCKHGCCHPLFWLAWCCTPVVLAQVLFRMKLDWCGNPTDRQHSAVSFRTVISIYIVMIVASYAIGFCTLDYSISATQDPYNEEVQSNAPVFLLNLQRLLNISFTIYIVMVMTRARRFIRNKYAIPSECCNDCEDCCCSYWCGCCTVSQMARHTADYDTYAAQCCTMTGLPSHIPEIV